MVELIKPYFSLLKVEILLINFIRMLKANWLNRDAKYKVGCQLQNGQIDKILLFSFREENFAN